MNNFAITGAAGFVAPRHLNAIKAVGGRLIAAADPHDSVGILDRYSFDVRYFQEFERFDRHLEKLRRGPTEDRVHFLSICSPNYLHDAHIRLALRVGATAICEKPVVINPWNLDPLSALEHETGARLFTILQLRLHPKLLALRQKLQAANGIRHRVSLTYITARGYWYGASWKGNAERSGGLLVNIGIHLFDLLLWLFGPAGDCELFCNDHDRATGALTLATADVDWSLSTREEDLPFDAVPGGPTSYRRLLVDGEHVEFSDGFTDLHTRAYEEILAGRGFGIEDARASIELVHRLRHAQLRPRRLPSHSWSQRSFIDAP
jgi:UDP-N-acetyl-2-amino-2-deoxyglucuronate dehydrogenase